MLGFTVKEVDEKSTVIYLSGRIDIVYSEEIEKGLNEMIENGKFQFLIWNMEKVEYISSSGFKVAIVVLKKLKEKKKGLKLCNIRPSVKRIFDMMELTSLFEIYETEEKALSASHN